MRRLAYLILGLGGLAALAAAGVWLLVQSDFFWTWGAHRLVDFAQERLYPTLTVREARGHPLTGLTFRGISLTGPEGEILQAERLEISFSLWSFVRLRPIIGRVAVFQPHLRVWWEPDGQVNLARILRPRPPPPFQSIDISDLLLAGARVEVHRQGEVRHYGPMDLQAALTVLHPKRPEQTVLIRRAGVVYDDPRGQLKLATRLTYSREQLSILDLEARVAEELLARFTGQGDLEAQPTGAGTLEVGPASRLLLHRFLPGWPAAWPVKGTFRLDLSPGALQASGAGQLEEMPFSLKGRIGREAGEWHYELEVDTPALAPRLLEPWRHAWAQTLRSLPPVPARLSGRGAGLSWPPAALDWNLAVGAVTWRGAHLAAGQASLSGTASQQKLQVQARGSFGKLAAALSGPWLTEARGQVNLEAEAAQPALLGLAVPPGTQVTGRFTGGFSLPHRDPGRLSLTGELAAMGRVGDLPVQEAKARLTWERGRLELSRGSLRAGNLAAEISGSLSAAELALKARGRLSGSPPLGPPLGMSGASFTLALSGPWRRPQADVTMEVKDLAWQDLAAHSLSLRVTLAGWPPEQGHGTLRVAGLKTPVGTFSEGSLSAQGEAARWRLQGRARGAAESRLEMAGLLEAGGRPLNLTLDRLEFTVGKFSGGAQGPVRLAFAPAGARHPEGERRPADRGGPAHRGRPGRPPGGCGPAGGALQPSGGAVEGEGQWSGDPVGLGGPADSGGRSGSQPGGVGPPGDQEPQGRAGLWRRQPAGHRLPGGKPAKVPFGLGGPASLAVQSEAPGVAERGWGTEGPATRGKL
jgi:hypothetical protein